MRRDVDGKFRALKRKLVDTKKFNKKLEDQMDSLRDKLVNTWKIEEEISQLSHRYHKGDIVVMPDGEMAEVRKLVRRKHYELFVQCRGLRSKLGTHQKVHESGILCHAMDLELEQGKIRYDARGWRCDDND
jgi:predicted RNase H-like nuclease (RuvC/YqgF family)